MKFHLHHHNKNNFSNVLLQDHTIIGQHKKNYNKAFYKNNAFFCLVAITNYRSIKPYFFYLEKELLVIIISFLK